jgi:protein-export membrane protein SecD
MLRKSWNTLCLLIGLALIPTMVFGAGSGVHPPDRPSSADPWLVAERDVQRGSQVLLEIDRSERLDSPTNDIIDRSVMIIGKRIKELGLAEATIQREGENRILVQVPGLDDPQRLADVVGKTARLQFRRVDTSMRAEDALRSRPPLDSEVLFQNVGDRRIPVLVYTQTLIQGADIADAEPRFDQRIKEPVVTFKFTARGARRFATVTQENVGYPLAIVLDDEVISAPVIREPILGGSGQISGNFTAETANNLAILLRAGALPAKFIVIEKAVMGPRINPSPASPK